MGNCINSSLSKTIYHQQLGHLQKQYHQNYTIEYLKSTIKLQSRQKYQKWNSDVKKIKFNTETKGILLIPQKIILQQSDIFKNQPQIQIFYQPFIQTLEDLMQRYKIKKYYPSQQLIWYLIYTLIKVGKYFQKINSKIGTINLSNVVVSPNRQFKVICQKSTLQFIPSIQQIKLKLSDKVLLAPQEIQFLNKVQTKNPEELINPQISEVYSIGLLVLGVSCMIEPHKFYDYHPIAPNKISIDYKYIQSLFEQLKKTKRISELLIQTIREMIEQQPEQRIRSSQLFKRLSEYQNEILTKKGLNYSGQQISQIQQSLNGSFANRTVNNSFQTNVNKSLQNHTLSFRVSQISQSHDNTEQNEVSNRYLNANFHKNNAGFINIL